MPRRMNASYAFMLLAVGADPASRALLLDDLRVIEGLVQSDAGIVRVTPPNGPPVVVKAAQVLFNGADREAVYSFLVERTDTKTAVGHARLANWCDRNGLSLRAAAHAKSAAAFAPTDTSLTAWSKALAEKASKRRLSSRCQRQCRLQCCRWSICRTRHGSGSGRRCSRS